MTLLPVALHAQGVVSSSITGSLLDPDGKPVSGATVTAVHVPTNSTYTAITSPAGRFSFSGLRVGGPYSLSGNATGFVVGSLNEIYIELAESTDVTLQARSDVLQLDKFLVTAGANDLDATATGAVSVLNSRAIASLPTANRSFSDLTKTNPFVAIRSGQALTALGMNNRYNSISIDGARQNDTFGLSSTGLFSLKNPFSLDALESFSVQLTPYDGTQSGFAGASINAVSKSGTNEFHGSAYYIYTSHKWQGADVYGTTQGQRFPSSYERTVGGTLGGPIIKDKLFFFLNYEKFSNPSGGAAIPGFQPDSGALSFLTGQFSGLPGSPAFGTFGGGGGALLEDEKKLAKIDWNITKDHRLSVRWSTTEGTRPQYPEYSTTGAPSAFPTGLGVSFGNGVTTLDSKYYTLPVNEEVWAAQLFSNWTLNLKTELSFSKNNTDSLRATPVNLPEIIVLNVPGTSVASGAPVTTNTALLFGTDYSSMGNGIATTNTGFGGNASYTWKEFTFKAGFDREESDFENRNGSYGRFVYMYSPTLSLANTTPLGFVRNVSSADFPGTDISAFNQTGFFAQTKWEPNQRLNFLFVLRYDVLGQPIAPTNNPAIQAAFGLRNDGTLDGAEQLAPRMSFNYSLDNDRTIPLRGGLGVFLGRSPWVWMSNSYGNAGMGRGTTTLTSGSIPTLSQYLGGTFSDPNPMFKFDPASPLGVTSGTFSGGNVAFTTPDIKPPTNLRGNLAVDFKMPFLESNLTVEYIHTDVMEAFYYQNINLVPVGTGADGRTRFSGRRSTAFNVAALLGNTSAGGSDYVAFSLGRPFKNRWSYNVTYTRGKASEAQPAGSSTATSQIQFNVIFNQNTVEETRSDYEVRDRLQASISREFEFFRRYKTVATLQYEGRSGLPYSYVYSGDLNGDGYTQNDALAVPTGLNDPRFDFSGMTTAQRDAYLDYVSRGELGRYAGSYAPRNAFLGPWQNRLNLYLSQEVKVAGPVRVEVFANFINFGSWLSKDLFNYIETFANPGNSNQSRVLGNAAYNADGLIRPTVALNSDGSITIPTASQFLPNNGDSRWQIMAGVRLKF
ncbi:MAG TPA: carboxypeptidase regulatory-like domain-containing protein [Opitutaceae bacterium]|nr:carboxypeptidase regulatory-like domain-containing protein [Opitutaceae bacterium]